VVVAAGLGTEDPDTGAQSIRDVKEQEVYFGENPADEGETAPSSSTGRAVVVSQLHRSPGAFSITTRARAQLGQAALQRASFPTAGRGSTSSSTQGHPLGAHRPAPQAAGDVLLRALGAFPTRQETRSIHGTPEESLNYFYATETIHHRREGQVREVGGAGAAPGQRATRDITDPKDGRGD